MMTNHASRPWLVLALFFWFLAVWGFAEPGSARASWQEEWEKTVEAARQEGQVTVYTSSTQNTVLLESGAFQKKFPKIKLLIALGNPLQRIMTERRAGKYLADVPFTGPRTIWNLYRAGVLEPVKGTFILPEVKDESKWFRGRHQYVDKTRKYIFVSVANPDSGNFYYNTKLIDPSRFHSMWDFLRPEWKGKIEARDIRTPGPGSVTIRFYYYVPELGPKFITRMFSEMDVTLFRNQRQGIDWLASGKYPICVFCNSSRIEAAKLQGLPVEKFGMMKEGAGLSSGGGGIGFMNRAPHPNAAKVFINWYLSRDGQIALQSLENGFSNSRRMDISRDMIAPERRLRKDGNYVEVETEDRMSSAPMLKLFNAALAEAAKRKKR